MVNCAARDSIYRAAAAGRRRGRAGTTRPGRNHAKPAHPGNDTSRGGFGVVAGQFPVTIQWTTESGTGSSAPNASISACSTTTAGYPGCPPAGSANRRVDGGRLGGRDRGMALGAAAGKPGGFSASSGVPGTVEGGTAGFASAGLLVGCGGHRCWLGGRVACGGGASGGRRKARRADRGTGGASARGGAVSFDR